ncbi:MAG: methyltransferase domain-containing protein [Nitrososphaerales archaeon]
MLIDTTRTGTYHQAILGNAEQFRDKCVMDLGAGSGILSWFALQAGARHVYCIEAAEGMVRVLSTLAASNGYADRVTVLHGKVEELDPSSVLSHGDTIDLIVSEPMGVLLLHERMIESFVYARDRFLGPARAHGDADARCAPSSRQRLFPSAGRILFSPFSDAALHYDVWSKALFWQQTSFYQVDLSALAKDAVDEYFSHPVVGPVRPASLMSAVPSEHAIDFATVTPAALRDFRVPLRFTVNATGIMHGLAGWFDVCLGQTNTLVLSTGPASPPTHWYQLQLLFRTPLAVNRGQTVSGFTDWRANSRRSYDLALSLRLDGTVYEVHETYHLQNQQYSDVRPPAERGGGHFPAQAQDPSNPTATLHESTAFYHLY